VPTQFSARDYLVGAITSLVAETKGRPLGPKDLRIVADDGFLPRIKSTERCEAVIPINIELEGSAASTAKQSKVKPAGIVVLSFAGLFDERIVFVRSSGLVKLRWDIVSLDYASIREVNPVSYRYKLNDSDGLEVLHTNGRLPIVGNDAYKYDKAVLQRWNRLLELRLSGRVVPVWSTTEPSTERWTAPTTSADPSPPPQKADD
jgi:hypothetical protein